MDRLKDKVAVITGGASGIGLATVELFIEEGAQVVVADIQDDKGRALEEKYKESLVYLHTDVTRETDIKAMVDVTVERFGRLDCLFNNAGFGGESGDIADMTAEGFHQTFDVLVLGVMLGMKYAAPVMKAQGSGSIINTASIAGIRTGYGPHIYSASKAAVAHVSRTAAVELAPFNVRVNSICPGAIATPIFAVGMGLPTQSADATLDAVAKGMENIQPIPRAGLPRDIAEAALFLASDGSSFVTGHPLVVDGGITLGAAHMTLENPTGAFIPIFEKLIEAIGPEALENLAAATGEDES